MNKLLTQTLLLIGIVLVGVQSVAAKGMSSKDLTVSAQGWYGYDIERSRPNLTSYGYMNYEVALGIQTSPERENPFAEAFGFPLMHLASTKCVLFNPFSILVFFVKYPYVIDTLG